jgi:hypothetical protein
MKRKVIQDRGKIISPENFADCLIKKAIDTGRKIHIGSLQNSETKDVIRILEKKNLNILHDKKTGYWLAP